MSTCSIEDEFTRLDELEKKLKLELSKYKVDSQEDKYDCITVEAVRISKNGKFSHETYQDCTKRR